MGTTPIERPPRGTPEYEEKVSRLFETDRETLELAEESILADQGRTHSRRTLSDGTVLDLTAYDAFDVMFTFRVLPDGTHEFIDFKLYEPGT